ncbi:toll/interleukin-1 receptor domain-containing protein [Microbacterium trichothecenolyticum]|uniref:TIR domain-containing protein n=1 Tax=Microbacterium trichothecenolyticum TaxID=69370 RepID=A0ABU0TWH6_MICTR|nr:toll/interleukin-1 receptor domain-containing protein [Microbacterium trichothecenolyticum]MDQ1124015.1 hypothetical protein [Microbacterium trichothecenolyticum]
MVTASEIERLRREAARLQSDIAGKSATVAAKRKKAAAARTAASRSKSQTTISSKLREAESADRDAILAEKQRSDLERKLADKQRGIATAEAKFIKTQQTDQKRAFEALRRQNDEAVRQFKLDIRTVSDAPAREPAARSSPPDVDVFLSHASEDKDDIARPLKEALETRGLSVWFDEINIKIGQSIRQEIESGIGRARFGVVILSPDFFNKHWTRAELDALFSAKMATGENLVLPVWHRVTKEEVTAHSPLLAGVLAANTTLNTVEEIADQIAAVVEP